MQRGQIQYHIPDENEIMKQLYFTEKCSGQVRHSLQGNMWFPWLLKMFLGQGQVPDTIQCSTYGPMCCDCCASDAGFPRL